MCPSCLQEMKVVGFRFTQEAIRQIELGRGAAACQGFHANRHPTVREVDMRGTVKQIYVIACGGSNLAADAEKQYLAGLLRSRRRQGHALRCPLASTRGKEVRPLSQRTACLHLISGRPGEPFR